MPTDIFISYRRVGGRDTARNVELALKGEGYENIFFDFNSLRDGVFNEQILNAIDSCKDYLLILSDGALDRCANEGDWVAIEIRRAMTADCKIIPIRVGESDFKWPDNLPKDLTILKSIQFLNLKTDEYFPDSIRRLMERMDSKPMRIDTKKQGSEPDFVFSLTVDETCELFINDERIRKVRQGKATRIDFLERQKSYHFTLKSLAVQTDSFEFDLTVPQFSKSMEKQVSLAEMRKERAARADADRRKQKQEREDRERRKENRRRLHQVYSFVDQEFDGRTLVGEEKDGSILYGYVDNDGFEIIPCFYPDAIRFGNGLAAVFDGSLWSYIDPNGNVIFSHVSETPGVFMNQVVPICKDGFFGLMDVNGQEVLPGKFTLITHAYNPFVVAKDESGNYYIFGLDGKPLTAYQFYESVDLEQIIIGHLQKTPISRIAFPCKVKRFCRFGLLSPEGKLIFNCVAERIENMFVDRDVLAFEHRMGGYPYGIVCPRHIFSLHELRDRFRPFFRFQAKGLWGLLDSRTGAVVKPAGYRHLSASFCGLLFSERCDAMDYGRKDAFGLLSQGGVFIPAAYCALFHSFTADRDLVMIAFKSKDFSRIRLLFESVQVKSPEWRKLLHAWFNFLSLILDRKNPQRAFPQLGDFSFEVALYYNDNCELLHFGSSGAPNGEV